MRYGGVGATAELTEWSVDPQTPEADHEPEWRVRLHVIAGSVAFRS